MEEKTEFKVGDLVVLKSGGPIMTVTDFASKLVKSNGLLNIYCGYYCKTSFNFKSIYVNPQCLLSFEQAKQDLVWDKISEIYTVSLA